MKKFNSKPWLVGLTSLAIFVTLSSFILRRGGDSYTLSLNGKQVIQHYFTSKDELPVLSVNTNTADKLTIYFSECGKVGTSRKLSIRDEKNKVLKEWSYVNVTKEHTPMTLLTSDINFNGDIGLFYSSETITTPLKLAAIKNENDKAVAGH